MSDRIALLNMRFEGRHGVLPEERIEAQPFDVDAELYLDLRAAGTGDDLTRTADYRGVFEICRSTIEGRSVQLIETLAESIASRILRDFAPVGVTDVVVRVRKPAVPLPGILDGAEVEIRRSAADVR